MRIALALVLAGALPSGLVGQADPWSGEAEVGVNFFFGNTEQATALTRLSLERADSVFEVALGTVFGYGEASDDEGETFVNKRSWELAGNLDYLPESTLSPFLIRRFLSSYEKQIQHRWQAGAGAKYSAIRDDLTRLDISVALLGERTTPRDPDGAPEGSDDLLARWSWRLRASRSFDGGRLELETVNSYRPEFGELGNYTVSSRSSVGFRVNERVTFKLSFVDEYDSEAVDRGARENNDGQILFSVVASY